MILQKELNVFKCFGLAGIKSKTYLQNLCFCSSTRNKDKQTSSQSLNDHENSKVGGEQLEPDHSCIKLTGNWEHECKTAVLSNMLVFRNFISEAEEEGIMAEIGPYLRRMRYEFDHWDDAIHGFRETERLHWRPQNERVLERVRHLAMPPGTPPLKHVHVLDLAADGVIKPHVDSTRFCGSVIAGVSLLSDAVMRLVSCAEPTRRLDALLPRRSLYIMRHTARYDYTHEVLSEAESRFAGQLVPRSRRISIICRNEPAPTAADQ
ncbi:alpha-ketoglutarate-dependent dioxygenase alkB homolog 7, mitochondrial-like [Amphibalanus amphitrite]|uniref:alpha-ketoglutarate-dependent dioxygenase alkB homolog 7, mitochondrial-like n=1 Tax=Amphibalanus amphitrite TaxID=1232801 RepID=UPI001C916583|nr:alpha-ketoglutarate-dependent dioxygenase alkB homolog 7, mitochondrial-like [Amphibalanus amphitrite]